MSIQVNQANPTPKPKRDFGEAMTRAGSRIADEAKSHRDMSKQGGGAAAAGHASTADGLNRALQILEEEYKKA